MRDLVHVVEPKTETLPLRMPILAVHDKIKKIKKIKNCRLTGERLVLLEGF